MEIILVPTGLIKREYFKDLKSDRIKLQIKKGLTVKELINLIGISKGFISLIGINNVASDLNKLIKDKDIMKLFPPVGGG